MHQELVHLQRNGWGEPFSVQVFPPDCWAPPRGDGSCLLSHLLEAGFQLHTHHALMALTQKSKTVTEIWVFARSAEPSLNAGEVRSS